MTDQIFDHIPGDGYPDGPVNSQGEEVRPMPSDEMARKAREQTSVMRLGPSLTDDDVGPPPPGEGDPEDGYPNPEQEVEC